MRNDSGPLHNLVLNRYVFEIFGNFFTSGAIIIYRGRKVYKEEEKRTERKKYGSKEVL